MATQTIGLVAGAVKAAMEVWYQYKISEDKKKAEECKKAAREYIQIDKREDTYSDIIEERADKLKKHFRKRFEHYY